MIFLKRGELIYRLLTSRYYKYRSKNVKHYTFVASTGRAGSMTLCNLFADVDGYASFHEPHPIMNGKILIEANNGNDRFVKKYFHKYKLFYIHRACAIKQAKYYIETNHMFIKSFAKHAVEYFYPNLKIIHLYRDPCKVAYSLYQMGEIPGTDSGKDWYLDYRSCNNLIKIEKYFDKYHEFKHPFYACLWYVYEIDARITQFKRKYCHVPVFELSTSDLNSLDRLQELFNFLGLDEDVKTMSLKLSKVYNRQSSWKKIINADRLTEKQMGVMLNRFLQIFEEVKQ